MPPEYSKERRRLAAIMFTDIVGYTSLMGADERQAMRLLRVNRRIQTECASRYDGRFLKEIGDGTLLRFSSASNALLAAGAIQNEAKAEGIDLRIGIHMGEVIEERNDVFGDGVNIASRIESVTESGEIYVSDTMAKMLANQPDFELFLVGEKLLKNVELPVTLYRAEVSPDRLKADVTEKRVPGAVRRTLSNSKYWMITAVVLALLTAVGYLALVENGIGQANETAIAVLPFATIGQSDASSFTQSIQGGILTRLSNISDLRVISRTSTLQYLNTSEPLPEIADRLGVEWIVSGEVQETDTEVMINARLVYAPEDRQVWAMDYREDLSTDNIFEIQSDIANVITLELKTKITPEEQVRLDLKPTDNLQAYRSYAAGLGLLEQRTPDAVVSSVDWFMKATSEDPEYAPAWAGLAEALTYIDFYLYADVGQFGITALRAAETALRLNPELAEAHASRGIIHYTRKEGQAAIASLKRAVQLQPSLETAHNWLGFVLLLTGNPEEALVHAKRTIELNPLAPAARLYPSLSYLANGDVEQALVEVQRARDIQPDWGEVYSFEGIILYHLGRYSEALYAFERADSLIGNEGRSIWLPDVRTMHGLTRIEMSKEQPGIDAAAITPTKRTQFWYGMIETAYGREEKALEHFQQIEVYSMWPTLSLRYYFPDLLTGFRQNPQFKAIIRDIDEEWK